MQLRLNQKKFRSELPNTMPEKMKNSR